MATSAFKHNKRRNPALIYEFLVRRMGEQLLSESKRDYLATLAIAKRHFGAGTALGEELRLFDMIRSTRAVPKTAARRILARVLEDSCRADRRALDRARSALLTDVSRSFGPEFFNEHRIPDYRLLASIHMMLEGTGRGALLEDVARIRLEEGIILYMTSTVPPAPAPKGTEEGVDGLVCALAARKFEERYGRSFNRDQNALLERYMRSSMMGEPTALIRHMTMERDRIRRELLRSRTVREVLVDPIMRARLDEALGILDKLDPAHPDEPAVQEMMNFQRLVQELNSDER